jgi:single-strand DNA-binding protein
MKECVMEFPVCNVAVVGGVLSSDPLSRELPSGDTVVSYEVTVRADGLATSSVPVAWFDPPAKSPALVEGDAVVVIGRINRRFFRAGGQTVSRTELVATEVVPARRRAAVARAVARAVDEVAAAEADAVGARHG